MSDEKEKGEYLKEVYLAKLRIDNICNSIIKCICDEFPKEEGV